MTKSFEKKQNPENYCFIWLDYLVNQSPENLQAQQILRTSIDHLLTFEDEDLCLQYIDSLTSNDHVMLIVSGRLGQTFVPQIAPLEQILSIYVYCRNKRVNEQWTKDFPKVKGVVDRLEELIERIQVQHHRANELLSINIYEHDHSSTELNGQFIHSQLLLDCLIRMSSSSTDRKDLLTYCQEQYRDNRIELCMIDEFAQNYSPTRAIWWYTRECFLYRLLNKALRVQNIDALFRLRFVITDIGRQLEKHRCSSPIRVYRSQQMSKEELNILKQSIGQFISMNSFLSTSLNREQARLFHYSSSVPDEHIERIFFEIDADPRLQGVKAFSRIQSFSSVPDEDEVLFMVGSIFRLERIEQDQNQIWTIRMVLCSENDHQLQRLCRHMKDELGSAETNLLIFGHVLRKMGKVDDAEKYYHRFYNQLKANDPNIAHYYHALGLIADQRGECKASLIWYNKSLEVFRAILQFNDPNLAIVHNSIAIIHQRKGDYTLALEAYEEALEIWKRTFGEDHPRVAICLNNIGVVHRNEKRYLKALTCAEKALSILEEHLPSDHTDLASVHGNIANIHSSLAHYDQALTHYHQALTIYQKSLPSQHHDIAMTLGNIGIVYENRRENQQALFYFVQAVDMYRHLLPSTHPNIIELEQSILRISATV